MLLSALFYSNIASSSIKKYVKNKGKYADLDPLEWIYLDVWKWIYLDPLLS